MGTGYTRNDASNNIADGNVINASDLDGEFDAVESAFGTSGHTHDGTAAEGGVITKIGPVQDIVVSATNLNPKTNNAIDLGTASLKYKDAHFQGSIDTDGVITAATFEPDGDTAAGDNAAIGYTAAEGLILTGQGSTSDITLKNDADAVVFTVPTGTDDILFPDNAKAMFGAGSDLTIFSDGGTFSYINNTQGVLRIRNTSDDQDVVIQSDNGSGGITDYFRADGSTGSVKLYNYGDEKLATTSTGVDITGTLTSDGLTVDGTDTEAAGNQLLKVRNSTTGEAVTVGLYAKADNGGDGNSGSITFDAGADGSAADNQLRFSADHQTDTNPALSIAGNGDISFYEDTGTTAKLFWDASAERLVIGDNTVSPQLDAGDLVVGGSTGNNGITIGSATTGTGSLRFADTGGTGRGIVFYDHSSDFMNFQTAGSERMRIDSSGNLLVGTTSTTVYTSGSGGDAGVNLRADGQISNSSNSASVFNRMASDGPIHLYYKDGTTVGSIGTNSNGNFQLFGAAASHVGLQFGSPSILPINNSGASSNGAVDLGDANVRFKDLYLSGGVYLGGTGAANLLDDYEEGTFTPVGADAASGGNTASAGTTGGFYTKIGRQVTVNVTLPNINTSGLTGGNGFYIQGLPFTHNSTSPRNVTGVVRADKVDVDPVCYGVVALITAGAASIQLYQNRDNTTDIAVPVSALQSGTADIFVTLTYDAT